MRQLSYIISEETDPYHNIALEEYLLDHVEAGECILYLWQNRKTVVIGYNQNAWRECRVEELLADGGFVARRLSGGGAVFHDLGNLNFTFLARRADYDVEKQSEVILRAVQSFGIPAIRTGRNDLAAEDRKFSGNAFYRRGDCCYHHGTILIRADKGQMSKYLTVSKEKLRSKGVESVKSRVVNLEEYVPDMTIFEMKRALLEAFAQVYGGEPRPFDMRRVDRARLQAAQERFGSWDWLYGRKIPFQYEVSRKFDWGEVLVQLEVSGGVIRRAQVWTDALDVDFPQYAGGWLEGVRYRKEDLVGKLELTQKRELGTAAELLAEPARGETVTEQAPEPEGEQAPGQAPGSGYPAMLADLIECLTEDKNDG